MHRRRVVVTGVGMVSPLGNTAGQSWGQILAGKSGIMPLKCFENTDFPVRFAGTINDLEVERYIPHKDIKKMDDFVQYGLIAGIQAVEDAGLDDIAEYPQRVGVAIGSGIGGITAIENTTQLYLDKGVRKVSPFFIPSCIVNMVAGHLSIRYGAQGPNFSMATACTTGTHNIGEAARTIEYGDADVMIAGSSEKASSPIGLSGFSAARALSTRNDEPERASRPWDRDRDGFVLGDGAGVVVLEEYEHAKKRDARIYAELIGYGMSGDAYHITAPAENGRGARHCMENALRNATIPPTAVDYINAHATSTPAGDIAETLAIKQVFGDHAMRLAVSSTKSMTGHLLGATGGVEAIFSILALRDQVAPPTINLDHPDPACDLDCIPHEARARKMKVVLSNSFGFGGTNATLIFSTL